MSLHLRDGLLADGSRERGVWSGASEVLGKRDHVAPIGDPFDWPAGMRRCRQEHKGTKRVRHSSQKICTKKMDGRVKPGHDE
jgi:hypothetical protein